MVQCHVQCQGTFNFKGSNMFFFCVLFLKDSLFLISSWKTGTSRAAHTSQDWDHEKGHLLGFLSVTPFSDLESESEVAQSCPAFCDPMDHNLPGFSIHGIFQARVLEWVATSFSTISSPPRDQTCVSHIIGRHFTVWATKEVYSVMPLLLRIWNAFWPFEGCYLLGYVFAQFFYCLKLPCMKIYKHAFLQSIIKS